MNSLELVEETEQESSGGGWLATFADLMSLLMCFFVLLLSFSELDVLKFKQIAGSMKSAFGVQSRLKVQNIPKGTSVIAQEFSPAIPEPTLMDRIQQITFEPEKASLEQLEATKEQQNKNEKELNDRKHREIVLAQEQLQNQLEDTFDAGQFEFDNQGQQLIIRIKENGAFASGSAFLQPQFKPLLKQLGVILQDIPGKILVAGHTDDRQVNNELYQDNMELSAARAIAVARAINPSKQLSHVMVLGVGSAQPLVDNSNQENRAINRRVEISVMQGEAKIQELPSLPQLGQPSIQDITNG